MNMSIILIIQANSYKTVMNTFGIKFVNDLIVNPIQ